jgi:hypothetical protein
MRRIRHDSKLPLFFLIKFEVCRYIQYSVIDMSLQDLWYFPHLINLCAWVIRRGKMSLKRRGYIDVQARANSNHDEGKETPAARNLNYCKMWTK